MRSLLRFLLWPIADFDWQKKIDQRRIFTCLTPLAYLDMPDDGRPLIIGGHLFAPVELRTNGSIRVQDQVFPLGTDFDVSVGRRETISRAGEILLIVEDEKPQFILTYDRGYWLQWRFGRPEFGQAIRTELRLIRELAGRSLVRTILMLWFAGIFLFAIAFLLFFLLYLQSP